MFDLTQYTKAYAPSFTNLAKEIKTILMMTILLCSLTHKNGMTN